MPTQPIQTTPHPRSISGPVNPSMMTDMYEYTMLDATSTLR